MIAAKANVMALATVTGVLPLNIPNNSQSTVPVVNNRYIDKEMPVVSFVRMVFTAWGKKDEVVQNAAAKPMMVIQSIV
jgi:hypothetical protein